jgi:hypothetical protein
LPFLLVPYCPGSDMVSFFEYAGLEFHLTKGNLFLN